MNKYTGDITLLQASINSLWPMLVEEPAHYERLRLLWCVACGVNGLAPWNETEQELITLARDAGLIDVFGGAGEIAVRHVIRCARQADIPSLFA